MFCTRSRALGIVTASALAAAFAGAAALGAGLDQLAAKQSPLGRGARIAFLGDSITQAGAGPNGYARLIDEAVTQGRPELGVKILYAGISGNRVPDLQRRLERDVLSKKPTLVFIYIGINDVWHSLQKRGTPKDQYAAGLRDLIQKIRGTGAKVVLATPSVIGEKTDGSNPLDKMLEEYAEISRKVARESGVTLCDLHKDFAEYLKKNNPENKDRGVLTTDGVHLNAAGNRFVADCAAASLVTAIKTGVTKGAKADGKKAKKKIVFVAGPPSHGYASHEHYAGCLLLAKWLEDAFPCVSAVVVKNGWPKEPGILKDAAAIVIFSSGGAGHPMLPHLDQLAPLMQKGVGLGCIHYAVEVPKGKPGDALLAWIGGYFETFWSVNPHWTAEFKTFPDHPVARGLKPFAIEDEWYYHMRFPEGMKGVTPILSAVPPERTRLGKDSPHGGNPTVRARKGMAEHVGWVYQRPDGGRGFGFTGGHWHWNWASDGFRTMVLNAVAWIAGLDVPPAGVPSKVPSLQELEANQDKPQPDGFDKDRALKLIQSFNK